MSYFSNLSFNKISDSITDSINNAVTNLNDPITKLSIKSKTRQLQESLGQLNDSSNLPNSYILLEKKCDSIEKILKKIINVTKTFEIEGYDYPPNLKESFSDWWSQDNINDKDNSFLPRSFSQAISRVSNESTIYLNTIKQQEKVKNQEEEEEEDDDDEDLNKLIKLFEIWSICYKNIDQGKSEMDQLIINEFNSKLQSIINENFKNVNSLRYKVHDSRLKFDTIRNELSTTEKIVEKTTPEEESKENTKDPVKDENEKLLESLEDEFVSNTAKAVEMMQEITENTQYLQLIKLFQNFQLVYHKQCIQEIESSIKKLDELE